MPVRLTSPKPSFASGEISKRLYGRHDFVRYDTGLALCLNFVAFPEGGLTRRPPTVLVEEAYPASRLIPFELSIDDSSMLELGDQTLRFFRDGGLVTGAAGEAYTVTTPWPAGELEAIRTTRSGDVIYALHPSREPYTLSRFGTLDWRVELFETAGGPFLWINRDEAKTIKSSAATGSDVTLTASGWTFDDGHAGALFRIGATGIAKVTTVAAGGATATAEVLTDIPAAGVHPATTDDWAESFSDFRGWPETGTFFQQRLMLGTSTFIAGSVTNDFNNFLTGDQGDDALAERIGTGTQRANQIAWAVASKLLTIGTVGEEFALSASALREAVTPTNLKIDPATNEGSRKADAVRTNADILHVSKDGKRLQRLYYDFGVDEHRSEDVSVQSRHLVGRGIKRLAWQRDPLKVLWCLCDDGSLIALTFNREQELLAWHQHDVGGTIEDIAVKPSDDGTYDEVWLIVSRAIAGNSFRLIERLARYFDPDQGDGPATVPHLDCQIPFSFQTPSATIAGLGLFEGGTVGVVADGAWLGTAEVQGGAITLDRAVSAGAVGLPPRRAQARLLPTQAVLDDGQMEGRYRRVVGMEIRYRGGPGALAGVLPDDGDTALMEALYAFDGVMDQPPRLAEELKGIVFDGNWGPEDFTDIIVDGPFGFELLAAPRIVEAAD